MALRKTSFDIDERDHRRANLASAAMGLSAGELYRALIEAGLDSLAASNDRFRVAFELSTMDDESRMVLAGRSGHGVTETR